MNILAVDTAGKTAGVALLQDDRLLYRSSYNLLNKTSKIYSDDYLSSS